MSNLLRRGFSLVFVALLCFIAFGGFPTSTGSVCVSAVEENQPVISAAVFDYRNKFNFSTSTDENGTAIAETVATSTDNLISVTAVNGVQITDNFSYLSDETLYYWGENSNYTFLKLKGTGKSFHIEFGEDFTECSISATIAVFSESYSVYKKMGVGKIGQTEEQVEFKDFKPDEADLNTTQRFLTVVWERSSVQKGEVLTLWHQGMTIVTGITVTAKKTVSQSVNSDDTEIILESDGQLPTKNAIQASDDTYYLVGYLDSENSFRYVGETVTKGTYKAVFAYISTLGTKIRMKDGVTSAMSFGFAINLFEPELNARLFDESGNFKIRTVAELVPENTGKKSEYDLNNVAILNDVIRFDVALYNIPESYFDANVTATAVIGNGTLTSDSCTQCISNVAKSALEDLTDVKTGDYAYPVTDGNVVKYSPYTEAQRGILETYLSKGN